MTEEKSKLEQPSNYQEIVNKVEKLMTIDSENLDAEAIRTVNILSTLHRWYGYESLKLKNFMTLKDKMYLFRWKYYNGILDGVHYRTEPLHIKPKSSDIEKYLKADEKVLIINSMVERQDLVVRFLEESIRTAKSRSFDIRNAIEFRKMLIG